MNMTDCYGYQVMACDLVIASPVFQAFVNEVLWDMLNEWVMVYFPSNDEHVDHVDQVLVCL